MTFTLLLLSITFVSCGYRKAKASSTTDELDNKIRLSLVTQEAPRSPSHRGFIALANKLKELSDDTMNIEINQLTMTGSLEDIFTSVSAGQIDIAAMGYADKTSSIPELALVGKPYVVRDYEHFLKILDSSYGKKMENYFHYLGIVHSSLWYLGYRHTTSNTPINSIKDFEGLKYRIQPTGSLETFVQILKAKPIAVSYNGLYDALKSGMVEAQENPIPNIEATKVYEHQKYLAMTGHLVGTIALFINKERYDTFTDEQKAWYNEAMEHGRQVCYNIVVEQEDALLEKFENEYGMMVTYPNKNELRDAMKPIYEEAEQQLGIGSISELMAIQ